MKKENRTKPKLRLSPETLRWLDLEHGAELKVVVGAQVMIPGIGSTTAPVSQNSAC